jgi:hypothetical protein
VRRGQRRILEGAAIAAGLSGAPSTLAAAVADGPRAAARQGREATRAIGTLLPPGRPGLARGAAGHLAISLAVGELLGATLPRRGAVAAGALAGLGIGWVDLVVIARRRFPAIAALPLGRQLADHVAFGALFAAVADRP